MRKTGLPDLVGTSPICMSETSRDVGLRSEMRIASLGFYITAGPREPSMDRAEKIAPARPATPRELAKLAVA
jgi:hypothetical protein